MLTTTFIIQIALLLVLLAMSAFFSGSETAFFSLSDIENDLLEQRSRGRRATFVRSLNSTPDEILATILTGNMIVNIFATAISEALGAELFASQSELLSIAIMTVVLLLVGEMTPKSVAIRHALVVSEASAVPLSVVHTVLHPLVRLLSMVRTLFLSIVVESAEGTREEHHVSVLSAIRVGFEMGTLPESELNLLESFFDFRNRTAQEVMIPRIELQIVDVTTPIQELVALSSGAGHGRRSSIFLLFRDDVDHVVGYVHRRDLLQRRVMADSRTLAELRRTVHFVHPTKILPDLVREMEANATEVVVVIDEFGGTGGVVTYQTVVERLFDDFYPEIDTGISPGADGAMQIAGSFEVEELSKLLRVELPTESRTVGGLVTDALDSIPVSGQTVVIASLEFTVQRVEKNRVQTVRIQRRLP